MRALHVLLVEDNVVNQRVAVGLLSKRGHHVTVVANGMEALTAIAHRGPFDVALMDVQMPVMDGLDATRHIRERERVTGGHLRIVAMTAHAMKGDRERFVVCGMDAYLAKPIDPRSLFEAIETSAGAPGPRADAPLAARPALDAEDLRRRLGNDEALLAEVIRLFVEDCPARVAAITDAIDARDVSRLRAEAHALKGSAGTLAACRVRDIAQTLETIAVSQDLTDVNTPLRALVEESDRVMAVLRAFQARG